MRGFWNWYRHNIAQSNNTHAVLSIIFLVICLMYILGIASIILAPRLKGDVSAVTATKTNGTPTANVIIPPQNTISTPTRVANQTVATPKTPTPRIVQTATPDVTSKTTATSITGTATAATSVATATMSISTPAATATKTVPPAPTATVTRPTAAATATPIH